MLHDAGDVAEADVDVLDLLVTDIGEYLFGRSEHYVRLLSHDPSRCGDRVYANHGIDAVLPVSQPDVATVLHVTCPG
ncbi:hypothetical protein GCM10023353_26390 [Tomitella cavernea]|uniref:Uncharacterized protein n=1 Tax=Tomitella cavernea TaxID=1387982 RepID=A0ABP9CSR0_9ACTN